MDAYGVLIGVRVNDAAALNDALAMMPPGATPTGARVVDRLYSFVAGGEGPRPGMKRLNLVYADGGRLARARNADPVLEALATDARRFVAEASPRRVFIHAGAVQFNGRAIVIPGSSFSGKTTLVRALLERGARYLSDEFAVLDARGRVHPFAKPLSVRPEGSDRGVDMPLDDIGGRIADAPVPCGMIVITAFESGRTFKPKPGTAGEGALALIGNAIAARTRPQKVMGAAHAAAKRSVVIKGSRGESDAAADAIIEWASATKGWRA